MSEILNDLKKTLAINHKKLEGITPISEMPSGQPWDLIKELYSQQTPIEKILATLFNAIATSKKRRFLMAASTLQELLEADQNQSRKTISGTDYKQVLGRVLDTKILKVIEPPSKFGKGGRNGGIYEITYPIVVKNVDFIDDHLESASPVTSSEVSPKASDDSDREHEYASENAYANEPESIDSRQTKQASVPIFPRRSYASERSPSQATKDVGPLPVHIDDLESKLSQREMILQMGDDSVKDEVFKLRDKIAEIKKAGSLTLN